MTDPAEAEVNLMEDRELGVAAAQAAREYFDALSSQTESADTEVLRRTFLDQLDSLAPEIDAAVLRLGRQRKLQSELVDELRQELWLIVHNRIRRYQPKSFRGWLNAQAEYVLRSHWRRRARDPRTYDDLFESTFSSTVDQPEQSMARPADSVALQKDIASYLEDQQPPSDQYKMVFLASFGLSAGERRIDENFSLWYRTGETAIERMNRLLFDLADAEMIPNSEKSDLDANFDYGLDYLEIAESVYRNGLRQIQQRFAQTVRRHLWRLVIRPHVWQYILRNVPAVTVPPEAVPDISTLRQILLFDAWIVLQNPKILEGWLGSYGVSNSTRYNFLALWSENCFVKSEAATTQDKPLLVNAKKLAVIDNWLAESDRGIEPQPTDTRIWRELLSAAARYRCHVDLPLPFRSEDFDAASN